MTQTENHSQTKPRLFKSLWSSSNTPSAASCCSLFSDCVHVATSRTCEYLHFTDPDKKFQPSSAALREIFLMTYIQRSFQLNLANTFSCTVMTQGQRFLLGTDWVWAVLDTPSKNPRIQIAVQVLHLAENTQENFEEHSIMEMESFQRTRAERLVEFCAGIGRSCFALFLFFGRKNDPGSICGLLSNNLHQALGKCVRIDQAFIEGFFKGARGFVTATGMLQAVVGKKANDPLTMLVKFT
ncbi:rab15 effector protein [Pangasianodon hypophthalmus]|uniref:rab15 effector protein n=1 Tax=Pangasianodon hypophthalmus TaxID=310915 RepID=UPI000EFE5EC1|nr:rab15 effector protein [Pangasianodon hypophthalmus]